MDTLTITRVVHASVLIDFAGQSILTDPWFTERTGYRRAESLGVQLAQLPRLSGVVVSHPHGDHDDLGALATSLPKDVPIAVKRGTAQKARRAGFSQVSELDPWETAHLGAVTVIAAPAKHGVPENTYLLQAAGFTVYFGGDSLLIPALGEIAERFPQIDVALLPINGLTIRPLLNRQVVMNAREAARLCAMLRPRVAIPMHYGFRAGRAFDWLLSYPGTPEQFQAAVAEVAPHIQVYALSPGEPFTLNREGN